MIELINVSKSYYIKNKKIAALNNVSISFPNNGLIFITGKSGSGKTTLLNVIGGLDTFDSGSFKFQGNIISDFNENSWSKYRNSYVGYIFQDDNLLEEFNVYENISLPLGFQRNIPIDESISKALDEVGLKDYEARKINELSGGQKQRVAIARSLVKQSKVLLADEPTGSLDSETSEDIFKLLKRLSKTQLIIVVSHDISSAEKYGDEIIEIKDGNIIKNTKTTKKSGTRTPLNLKKGKIDSKCKLKLSINSFLRKPFRFLVLLFLCTFGFSLMAGAIKFCFWNPEQVEEQLLSSQTIVYVSRTAIEVESDNYFHMMQERKFDDKSINDFCSLFPGVQLISYGADYPNDVYVRYYSEPSIRESTYYGGIQTRYLNCNQQMLEKMGFTLEAGTYPSDDWELSDIGITKHMFEMFKLFGFYNYDKNTGIESKVEIKSYKDIIGLKSYTGNTIKCIIDTHEDLEQFSQIKNYALGVSQTYNASYETSNYYNFFTKTCFQCSIFLSPNYQLISEEKDYIALLYDEDIFEKYNIVSKILESNEYQFEDYYSAVLKNHTSSAYKFGKTMLIVAFTIIIFSIVLFTNFISTSILEKYKQIGILCALGADKKSIMSVFVLQNILTGTVIFICSFFSIKYLVLPLLLLLGTADGFPVAWYSIGAIDYVLIFAAIISSSIISSTIPFVKFWKKSPREIICGK